MRGILRYIFWIIILLLVILGLAWAFSPTVGGWIVGSKLNTQAHIQDLEIRPHHLSFQEVKIQNPSGFRHEQALLIKKGSAKGSILKAMWGNPVVLDEIVLQGIEVLLEFPKGMQWQSSNWGHLLASSSGESSREILIHSLVLQDIHVEMMSADGTRTTLKPINEIRLKDVSTASGIQLGQGQLIGLVLQQMLSQILSVENLLPKLLDLGKGMGEAVGSGMETITKPLMEIPSLFKSSEPAAPVSGEAATK